MSAAEWLEQHFPSRHSEHALGVKLCEWLKDWQVHTKPNSIFERMILNDIVNKALVVMDGRGDFWHPASLRTELNISGPLLRFCLQFTLTCYDGDDQLLCLQLYYNPRRDIWQYSVQVSLEQAYTQLLGR
jgi:hypothetical protein